MSWTYETPDLDPDRGEQVSRDEVRGSIGLIEACDGPVVDLPKIPPPTMEAIALREINALRNAVLEPDSEALRTLLAPAILDAHGEQEVAKVLLQHLKQHGYWSMGTLEFGVEAEVEGNRVRAKDNVPSDQLPDGPQLKLEYDVEVHDGHGVVTGIKAIAPRGDREPDLVLEVTETRLGFWPVRRD